MVLVRELYGADKKSLGGMIITKLEVSHFGSKPPLCSCTEVISKYIPPKHYDLPVLKLKNLIKWYNLNMQDLSDKT